MSDLPTWVLRLVSAVGEYEDEHPNVHDQGYGVICFNDILKEIPTEVAAEAHGYMRGKHDIA